MALNIQKEQQASKLIVTKMGLTDYKFNVEHFVDVSGSMQDEFREGLMDAVFQRVMALASVVDPDGNVRFVAFSDKAIDCGEFGVENFDNITKEFLGRARPVLWSGTDYATPFDVSTGLRQETIKKASSFMSGAAGMFKNMFGSKKPEPTPQEATVYPRLVIFTTDGENYGIEQEFFDDLERALSDDKTFVILLGVGNNESTFRSLQRADDKFFGVSFVHAKNIRDLNNEGFYNILLNDEFSKWLKKNG